MTGLEIKAFFENIIDDALDEDFTYELMNNALGEIYGETDDWVFLRKLDSSQTASDNNTIATDYTLPTDLDHMTTLYVGDYLYLPVPWVDQRQYRNTPRRFFIDDENTVLRLCGGATASTIYQFYQYRPDDIGATTSPVFPAKFHKRIGFVMAELYASGIDGDDLNFKMTPQLIKRSEIAKKRMIDWNTGRILLEMDHSSSPQSSTQVGDPNEYDIGML